MEDGDWIPALPTVEEALRRAAGGRDELHLYQQDLPVVPPPVREFRHLRTIYLYNSYVRVLPDWLAELPELTLLDVSRNELTEVPFALLCKPGLELRMSGNPLDLGRMFRTLIANYNEARTEDVAAACDPGITLHLPRVRPADGTGREAVAKMLNDAYPRYGRIEVVDADQHRAVLKPARAPQIEMQLTWRYGRLSKGDGGRCR
ncbi:leucine-rich repeat domain-containing protein [Paractinoplanes durhamensis]|uniref:Leucine-rich repeat domain-containing protein n=1 Tax=Paractinoplanes durhamensis TaxID=113563 RepID=A0ABQ3Z5I9_9ACTN|nr:leucine-rich repeat domain-containing protein [Actinoplanes durhamensis]GIE05056.1 hypothetical protein Adu01nite_64060 [Actinoplanes durhamensis]